MSPEPLARSVRRFVRGLPGARCAYHLLQSAVRTLRYRLDCLRFRRSAAGLPIPPARLNLLVTGASDVEWYAKSGWLAAQSVRFALERNAVGLDTVKRILDFGCGSGRVIRHWHTLPAEVHGTDYNPELVRWCQRRLPFARFELNGLEPPLQYPNEFFDLVYALSVFTHLDEFHQCLWIEELRRITRPDGYIIITTHGNCPLYTRRLNAVEARSFQNGELVVHSEGSIGSNSFSAYHPIAYVCSRLASGLTLVSHLEGGAFGNPYQDLYLFKKPPRDHGKPFNR